MGSGGPWFGLTEIWTENDRKSCRRIKKTSGEERIVVVGEENLLVARGGIANRLQ